MLNLDEKRYPVLQSEWSGETTIAEVDQYVAWLRGVLDRAHGEGKKVAVVAITSKDSNMTSPVRSHMNAQLALLSPAQEQTFVASCIVDASPLIAGILTAMRWMSTGSTKKVLAKTRSYPTREAAYAAAEKATRG